MITAAQCRAARAWLNMTQGDLAHRSRVAETTVRNFESGRLVPHVPNLAAIEAAFTDCGVTFSFHEDGSPAGIEVRRQPR
jgi:DNA-binding XRE family transcriptional regulator